MIVDQIQCIQGTKLFLILVLETSANMARAQGDMKTSRAFRAASERFQTIAPESIATFLASSLFRDVKKLDNPRTNLLD